MAIHNDSMFGHASIKQAGCEQMRMQLQLIWCGDVSVDTGYLQVSGACRKRSLRATALLIEVRLPGEPNLRRILQTKTGNKFESPDVVQRIWDCLARVRQARKVTALKFALASTICELLIPPLPSWEACMQAATTAGTAPPRPWGRSGLGSAASWVDSGSV